MTALTAPVARSALGTSALTRVDLPTPLEPTSTVIEVPRYAATTSTPTSAPAGPRWSSNSSTSSPSMASAKTVTGARSVLVTTSTGCRPPSYAATRQRSNSRRFGSGSPAATTIANSTALATMTRSVASLSSAVRRSAVRRGSTRTTRARSSRPSAPRALRCSPTRPTTSPTTTARCPSSRAAIAVTSRTFTPVPTAHV